MKVTSNVLAITYTPIYIHNNPRIKACIRKPHLFTFLSTNNPLISNSFLTHTL